MSSLEISSWSIFKLQKVEKAHPVTVKDLKFNFTWQQRKTAVHLMYSNATVPSDFFLNDLHGNVLVVRWISDLIPHSHRNHPCGIGVVSCFFNQYFLAHCHCCLGSSLHCCPPETGWIFGDLFSVVARLWLYGCRTFWLDYNRTFLWVSECFTFQITPPEKSLQDISMGACLYTWTV